MIAQGAMDVLLLLAGHSTRVFHRTDVTPHWSMLGTPAADAPTKFPPAIPLDVAGFSPYVVVDARVCLCHRRVPGAVRSAGACMQGACGHASHLWQLSRVVLLVLDHPLMARWWWL